MNTQKYQVARLLGIFTLTILPVLPYPSLYADPAPTQNEATGQYAPTVSYNPNEPIRARDTNRSLPRSIFQNPESPLSPVTVQSEEQTNQVPTASNPNYYLVRRDASTLPPYPPVHLIMYDVYNKKGEIVGSFIGEREFGYASHETIVHALKPNVSPDGKYIVYVYHQKGNGGEMVVPTNVMEIYSTKTGELVKSIDLGQGEILAFQFYNHSSKIVRVDSTNAPPVTTPDGTVDLAFYFDITTGEGVVSPYAHRTASNPNYYSAKLNGDQEVAIFNKNGKLIAQVPNYMAQGNGTVLVGKPDVSPDGKYIVLGQITRSYHTGADEQTVWLNVLDLETGLQIKGITIEKALNQPLSKKISNVDFIAGSSRIVKVTFTSGEVEFYDIQTGQKVSPPRTRR